MDDGLVYLSEGESLFVSDVEAVVVSIELNGYD